MKSVKIIRILLLLLYCIPFAFLAVNGDATSGSMIYYGVMVAGFALLSGIAIITNNTLVVYIGNVLSFISSIIVSVVSGLEAMSHYFKPLTSHLLIVVISIIALLIQVLFARVYVRKNK